MFVSNAAPQVKAGAAVTNHWLIVFACVALCAAPSRAQQQQEEPPKQAAEQAVESDRLADAERMAEEALNEPSEKAADPAPPPAPKLPSMNLLELAISGGALMVPIALMSFVVVLFAVERWLGLRRRKIIPPGLVTALGQLVGRPGGLDPKQAYKLCQQFPSTAASVFRAVLLKVGRPHSEVEFAMKEASEREAAKLYKNVRPIELAVTVTPLLGLLGTVQGMIQAFFVTANSPHGNMGEKLANGIYVALVTTFAGLTVAIPAAMLAHYFEGRIQSLFRDVDELLLDLLPQLERFEGKLRVQRPAPVVDGEPRAEAQPAATSK